MSRSLEEQLKSQVRAVSGRPERVSTEMEAWQGLSAAIIDRIADRWHATERTYGPYGTLLLRRVPHGTCVAQ